MADADLAIAAAAAAAAAISPPSMYDILVSSLASRAHTLSEAHKSATAERSLRQQG